MESKWLKDTLFSGMTGNAWKLGTVLSLGWFWLRTGGCVLLYRGQPIDFDTIAVISEPNIEQIVVPSFLVHQVDTNYYYVVRKANGCGDEEGTFAAAVKVSIADNGNLAAACPNGLFAVQVTQTGVDEVELQWLYGSLAQQAAPVLFKIYHDGGSGQIDYNNPLATVSYVGRRFYSYKLGSLGAGTHRFAIRAEDSKAEENRSYATVKIELQSSSPASAQILGVNGI